MEGWIIGGWPSHLNVKGGRSVVTIKRVTYELDLFDWHWRMNLPCLVECCIRAIVIGGAASVVITQALIHANPG